MTRSSESELTLISRAPFQQRPVSMLPSCEKTNIGRFSRLAAAAAEVSDAAHGMRRQASVSLARMRRASFAIQATSPAEGGQHRDERARADRGRGPGRDGGGAGAGAARLRGDTAGGPAAPR